MDLTAFFLRGIAFPTLEASPIFALRGFQWGTPAVAAATLGLADDMALFDTDADLKALLADDMLVMDIAGDLDLASDMELFDVS